MMQNLRGQVGLSDILNIHYNNGNPIMLTHYMKTFSTLRSDTSRYRWTAATKIRAPHKTLLLQG